MFRGKRTDNGKWIEGWVGKVRDNYYILIDNPTHESNLLWLNSEVFQVYPNSVAMQTGVHDKNKEMIYGSIELDGKMTKGGDRVEAVGQEIIKITKAYSETKSDIYIFSVCWDNNFAGWKFLHPIASIHTTIELREYEIIGNQYDTD